MGLGEGDRLPDFVLPTDEGGTLSMVNLQGKTTVLYFYPRDDTPGCTSEAQAFRDVLGDFTSAGVALVGVSADDPDSHRKFKAKHGLNFTLASDADTKLARVLGVWVEKSMYGKTYMGMERATFLIDRKGVIRKCGARSRCRATPPRFSMRRGVLRRRREPHWFEPATRAAPYIVTLHPDEYPEGPRRELCAPKPNSSSTPSGNHWRGCGGIFDYDAAVARLAELNARVEDPAFWNEPARAQAVMRERTRLENRMGSIDRLSRELSDAVEYLELGEAEDDAAVVAEAEASLAALQRTAERAELEALLSGEADGNDCWLEVHAGAGGTEAQDWAEMLLRMYARWAERRRFEVEWIEESPGEEAGIKSATVRIKGPDAYGWMKTESGVHRLVRISPFDSSARRHTSFASVGAYPVIDDSIDIEILDKDLRVDTYRSSGAGGQHVNRTDSAVRLTHLPTGIVVQCQNDRSQHRNRAMAMQMLKARLYELELRKREEAAKAEHEAKSDIGWGHQIRSYVLQPYQMIKDLRTGVETSNTQAVLDGDLDGFMVAALAGQRRQKGSRPDKAEPGPV